MKVGEENAWRGPGMQETPAPDPSALDNLKFQGAIALEYAKRYGLNALRLSPAVGALTIAAAVGSYPLAQQEAIEETVVNTDIASAPTELRLTGNGWSSLQLGAPGSFFLEESRDGVGITAEVKDTPKVGGGTVQDLLSPEFKNLVSSLFSDPDKAMEGYVDVLTDEAKANFIDNEVAHVQKILALAGGALVISLLSMGKERRKQLSEKSLKASLLVAAGSLAAGTVALPIANSVANQEQKQWAATNPMPASNERYSIRDLEGTPVEGAVASNQILQIAANEAVPGYEKNVERMKQATNEYVAKATASFLDQIYTVQAPRDGEILYIALADPHGNEAMIRVNTFIVNEFNARFGEGTVKFVTISGDLTMNGSPSEKGSIEALQDIGEGSDDAADGAPVVAVGGNHESEISIEQMEEAGMIIPNLETKTVRGVDILGANDTDQNKLGTSATFENKISEAELGSMVREIAESDDPDIVLLHQGYAVMAFLKQEPATQAEIMEFLAENGVDDEYFTTYREDDVPNAPASIIDFGHWHSQTTHKVLWNKDEDTGKITWTLVRELNTAGGGDGSPTINHFPLPTYPPIQNAGFEITYMNSETGLATGFASPIFTRDAVFVPSPRTDVGLPGGLPGQDESADEFAQKGPSKIER